MLTACESLLYL